MKNPARTSALQAKVVGSLVNAQGFGTSLPASLASFDPESWSWKTSQLSVLEDSTPFSGRWPRAGMMRNGIAYPLKPSAPLTAVTGSSWSRGEYPTPSATRYGSSQNEGKVPHKRATKGTKSLDTWARNWPTATARDGRHDPTTCTHGGECKPSLSPRFAEWLMGFPIGWTDLDR